MGPSSGASARLTLRLSGCLSAIVVLVVLGVLIVWAVMGALEEANRTMCISNLKVIGHFCQAWAEDHQSVWPDVFTEESTHWDDVGNTRTDEWNPVTNEGKPPKAEPGDNGKPIQSNTANFWQMIVEMGSDPFLFVCPSSAHEYDSEVTDFTAVRDFRGESFVSYSYQNVLGDYRLMSTIGRASTVAIVADANPMRRDFRTSGIGEKKREGVTDRELARKPHFIGEEEYIAAWNKEAGSVAGSWELNSPNHGFKGQNVLYLDGHAVWTTHPYVGPNWDNIWVARKPEDGWEVEPEKLWTIRHFNDPASYNGCFTLPADSTGDSFLVP